MLAAKERRHRVGGLDAANAADLVGHDLLAGATAAEDDAAVAIAGGNGARGRRDDVGIVDRRLGRVDAEVDHLVAGRRQPVGDEAFESEACMIGRQRDAHGSKVASAMVARC